VTDDRPLRVALTGGIATGKSACLRRFAEHGAAVLDADRLARIAVEPGTPGLAAVVARFGRSVLTADDTLDRTALGRIVFADPAARRDLESIVHPTVYAAIEAWFADLGAATSHADQAKPRLGIVDIPLLFETGRHTDFDRVVVAACRPDQQVTRLMARDGLDEAAARARIAAQWPIDEKARLADFVIDTSGTLDDTIARTDAVWEQLLSA